MDIVRALQRQARWPLMAIFGLTALGCFLVLSSFDRQAPTLAALASPRATRLRFHADIRPGRGGHRPMRRRDLDWQRPREAIATALRQYGDLRERLAGAPPGADRKHVLSDLERFWLEFYERELFGWLLPYGPDAYLAKMAAQPGTVIVGSSASFRRTVHQLETLRRLGCRVGSEQLMLFHCRDDPFSAAETQHLVRVFGIAPVLLDELFVPSAAPKIHLYNSKLFAAIAAPFAQMAVLDSDAVLFACPEAYPVGRDTVFFLDRQLHPNNHGLLTWLLDTLPQPFSPALRGSALLAQQTSFLHDSSLVLLDKGGRGLWGLLAAARLTDPDDMYRREDGLRRFFSGEKEAWWLGWELAGAAYRFEARLPGSIGFRLEEHEGVPAVCGGKLLHFFPAAGNGSLADGPGWGGLPRPFFASGGVDREAPELAGQPALDHFDHVTDGLGRWTAGLCQIGTAIRAVADVPGYRDALALIRAAYSADPLLKPFKPFEALEPLKPLKP